MSLDRYSHKIKTKEELLDIRLGEKIILAAGCFDVVHPGHIRHLLYAKDKAPILVVAITSDRYVNKRDTGPHIPQELRAANLAAFEFIDYVVIDDNKKPTELLSFLQPEFFAKGYEYSPELRDRAIEEVDILNSYGGEMIYSPGDYVYSSSALIKSSPPDVKFDKLIALMGREDIKFDTLRRTLELMEFKKIHVVGDTIVDTITNCTSLGAQAKTPTISALLKNKWDFVGGAGIVAKHLKAAGADVLFTTVLGNDDYRNFVCDDLKEYGVVVKAVIDETRPTTNKNAIVVDDYRMIKVDSLDNRTISNGVLTNIEKCIKSTQAQAVVFSDFRHGIFNRRTLESLISAIPEGIFKVADSQVATRWGNIIEFGGFDLVTPNEKEARFAMADQDSGIRALASELYDTVGCKTLMLKMGPRGVITCRSKEHESFESYFTLDSFAENVIDPVGAGDAFLAYATLSMLISGPVEATILGSIAAACECESNGNIPVTREDVLDRLTKIEKGYNINEI